MSKWHRFWGIWKYSSKAFPKPGWLSQFSPDLQTQSESGEAEQCWVNGSCQDNHSASWGLPAGKGICLHIMLNTLTPALITCQSTIPVQKIGQTHDSMNAKSHHCLNNEKAKPTLNWNIYGYKEKEKASIRDTLQPSSIYIHLSGTNKSGNL